MKNPTEKVRKYMLYLLSRGIFRCAQYDVLFLYVILNDSEESHRKSEEVYALSLKSWDISLALNMTYFLFVIARK